MTIPEIMKTITEMNFLNLSINGLMKEWPDFEHSTYPI